MEVKDLSVEGLEHKIQVSIPLELIEKRLLQRLEDHGKSLKISGFRPGKVPLPILRQRYGVAARMEVVEALIQETSNQVLNEKNIRPAFKPEINVTSQQEEQNVQYVMTVESLPKVAVPDLKKYKFSRLKAAVDRKSIDEAISRLREHNKQAKDLSADHKAEKGNVVIIDFDGEIVGEKKIEGGAGKEYALLLGSNSFIPGFEDQLIGVKAGDETTVEVTFPADYHSKDIAGKLAKFSIYVHKVQSMDLPELNDDFAKNIGFQQFSELEKAIEDQISDEYEKMSFLVSKRHVLDALAEDNKFASPKGLVENEFSIIWRELERENAHAESHEHTEECQHESHDLEKPEVKEQYQQIAERRVRLGLLLAEIGKEHKIEVTNKELERAVLEQARQYPGQEKQVFEYFRKDAQALASLRAPIFEDKVIKLILEKADVNQKDVTFEELEKAVKEITQGE